MRNLNVSLQKKIDILTGNKYLEGLSRANIEKLAAHTTLCEYERGEILMWEGDPCAGLFIIHEGSVKLFRLSPQGRQYILRVMQEGATCNEVPTFDGGTNPVNLEALETCRVWVVEPAVVQDVLRANPEFALTVIKRLGENLRDLVRMASELAFYQVTHRLARLIHELSDDELSGESGPRWTQDQMAARLGTVREVVARSLRELERSGAIAVENRRIRISDPKALSEWAQGPWN